MESVLDLMCATTLQHNCLLCNWLPCLTPKYYTGWASAWFVLLAVIIQLGVNTRLVYIARLSTRGGRVHRLERSVFWFGSDGPW